MTRSGSANANLSALSLSSGTLAPVFASGTTSYTASVGNATTSLTVTPTVADATASITVNGVAVTSGNASGAIALNVGSNTITTVVTAQDGTTTKTYTVTVTRAASANADLSALSLSSGTLSPVFVA
ncbi:cadherin-like beta sandwich domain-containing protein [Massilia sp. B-10]|nr:cadherin-like beta sandwich domain-containing protein [Massilia sp. B-10]